MSTSTSQPLSVQRLLPRHFKIIELALAGHDVKVIAETVQASPGTVGLVLRSPIVQAEMARRRKESQESNVLGMDRSATVGKARMLLEQAAESAAITLENALLDEKPQIRLRAAEQILDRALGEGADSRRSVVVNVTTEQMTLLTLALKESQNAKSLKVLPANGSTADPSQDQLCDVLGRSGSEGLTADSPSADGSEGELIDVLEESDECPRDV